MEARHLVLAVATGIALIAGILLFAVNFLFENDVEMEDYQD